MIYKCLLFYFIGTSDNDLVSESDNFIKSSSILDNLSKCSPTKGKKTRKDYTTNSRKYKLIKLIF